MECPRSDVGVAGCLVAYGGVHLDSSAENGSEWGGNRPLFLAYGADRLLPRVVRALDFRFRISLLSSAAVSSRRADGDRHPAADILEVCNLRGACAREQLHACARSARLGAYF